jgi:hypothetical protein
MLSTILFYQARDPVLWRNPAIGRRIDPFLVEADTFDISGRLHFIAVRLKLWLAHGENGQREVCLLSGWVDFGAGTDMISVTRIVLLCHSTGTLVPSWPVNVLILAAACWMVFTSAIFFPEWTRLRPPRTPWLARGSRQHRIVLQDHSGHARSHISKTYYVLFSSCTLSATAYLTPLI